MGGISIGTFALLLILSVFNGFAGLVLSLYNQFTPDIIIESSVGKSFAMDSSLMVSLDRNDNVRALAEVIEENVLLRYGNNQCLARIKGITDNYNDVSDIAEARFHGEYFLEDEKQHPFIYMGAGIEQQLQINYDDPFGFVSVYYPKKNANISGDPQAAFNVMQVKPSGSFAIQQEFDNRYAFVPLNVMKELTGNTNKINSLELSLLEPDQAAKNIRELKRKAGNNFTVSNRYPQKRSVVQSHAIRTAGPFFANLGILFC